MEQRAGGGRCVGSHHGKRSLMPVTYTLMLATCAVFIFGASGDDTLTPLTGTIQTTPSSTVTYGATTVSQPATAGSVPTTAAKTSPGLTSPSQGSFSSVVSELQDPHTATTSVPTTTTPSTTATLSTVGKLTTSRTTPTVASSSDKPKPALPGNVTSSPGVRPAPSTVTPAEYVVQTGGPDPTSNGTTRLISPTRAEVGTTSGAGGELTTAPPTTIVYETVVVTELVLVDSTAEKETVESVTLTATTTVGGGSVLDPDHEKGELKKLLLIIGASVGVVIFVLLISFAIIYRVAKTRNKKANSRYYNFKKKKSNYEKVLHLQEYYGDLETDTGGTGTGTAWVFDENDGDANKAITLEMNPKGKEVPARKPGKMKKSRNKNKNNRNKSAAGRGNYQVLAEMFPNHSSPPDVLLSVEGAVHSNSDDDDESAVLDTSFGPAVTEDKADSVVTDGGASTDSFSDSMRISWPAWNSSPYVTITQEDAGVEL